MSSYMTKLEFPLELYMLFRLEKLPHVCCLLLHWVLSSFIDPYERFVMLLKSRSRTYHIYLLLLHWEYAKTCFPFRSTQKCSTPTLGMNTKTWLIGFSIHQINAPSSCFYLSKFCCRKEAWAMQKLLRKKEEKKKKVEKKWTRVWDI